MHVRSLSVVAVLLASCAGGGASPAQNATGGEGLPGLLSLVDGAATAGLHCDIVRFSKAPLYGALLTALHELHLLDALDAAERPCGVPPLDALTDVVMVGGPSGRLVAARVTMPDGQALACVEAITHRQAATFDSRPAVRLDDMVIVARGGVVYAGDEQAVRRALAGAPAGRAAFAGELVTTDDKVLAFHVGDTEAPVKTVTGVLHASPEEFLFEGSVEMATDADARTAEQRAGVALASARTQLGPGPLGELLAGAVKAKGKTVLARVEVVGDGRVQAARVSELASLMVVAVRRYIADARATAGNMKPGP